MSTAGTWGARTMVRAGLRFADPAQEARFRADHARGAVVMHRVGAMSGAVLTAAFGACDVWLVGFDAARDALLVRAGLVIALVGLSAATFRPGYARIANVMGPLSCTSVAWTFQFMGTLAPVPFAYIGLATSMMVVFVATLVRVTFGRAVASSAAVTAGLVVYAAVVDAPVGTLVVHLAFTANFACAALGGAFLLERLRRREFVAEQELAEARAQSDRLLRNVLPDPIADRLRSHPGTIAEQAPEVSVVFADLCGFTELSSRLSAVELVRLLDELFGRFDALSERHGIEKIKTIGDAYMGVAGLPIPVRDHAGAAAEMALGMLDVAAGFDAWPGGLRIRVGIASGPVVAGVIGRRKFAYDLWGDAVNTASRMESHAAPGTIQLPEATRVLLGDRYELSEPRTTLVKGKGPMTTYTLLGRRAPREAGAVAAPVLSPGPGPAATRAAGRG